MCRRIDDLNPHREPFLSDGPLLLRRQHQRAGSPRALSRGDSRHRAARSRARSAGPGQRIWDGSAAAVREWNEAPGGLGATLELIERERRCGKAENDSLLLERSRGDFCLLLNEDTELCPGAARRVPRCAQGQSPRGSGRRDDSGYGRQRRSVCLAPPGVGTSLTARCSSTASSSSRAAGPGRAPGRLGPVRRDDRPPRARRRRSAISTRTSSSTRTRPTSASACSDAGWEILLRPGRRGHPPRAAHERPRHGRRRARRVPSQPRPLHAKAPRGRGGGRRPRALGAGAYAVRAAIAVIRPGVSPRWMWLQAKLAWRPRGTGHPRTGRGAQP